jgi:hypothetical protein
MTANTNFNMEGGSIRRNPHPISGGTQKCATDMCPIMGLLGVAKVPVSCVDTNDVEIRTSTPRIPSGLEYGPISELGNGAFTVVESVTRISHGQSSDCVSELCQPHDGKLYDFIREKKYGRVLMSSGMNPACRCRTLCDGGLSNPRHMTQEQMCRYIAFLCGADFDVCVCCALRFKAYIALAPGEDCHEQCNNMYRLMDIDDIVYSREEEFGYCLAFDAFDSITRLDEWCGSNPMFQRRLPMPSRFMCWVANHEPLLCKWETAEKWWHSKYGVTLDFHGEGVSYGLNKLCQVVIEEGRSYMSIRLHDGIYDAFSVLEVLEMPRLGHDTWMDFCPCRKPGSKHVSKRVESMLRRTSERWRKLFQSAIEHYFGRHMKASLKRVDYRRESVVEEGGSHWENFLEVSGIMLSHMRFPGNALPEWDEISNGLLVIVSMLRMIYNSKDILGAYSAIASCAALLGYTPGDFIMYMTKKEDIGGLRSMAGLSPLGSGSTIRIGNPPVGTVVGVEPFEEDDVDEVVELAYSRSGIKKVFDWTKSSLLFRILESSIGVGIAVLLARCLKGGVDPSGFTLLVRDSMRIAGGNIIDVFSSVLRAVSIFDFSDAFSILGSHFFGSDAIELGEISESMRVLMDAKDLGSTAAVVRAGLLRSKLLKLKMGFVVNSKKDMVKACDGMLGKIDAYIEQQRLRSDLSGVRVPPLLVIGHGIARSGKSMIPLAMGSALASVFDLDPEYAREITYLPQTGSQYMEGFAPHHLHIHRDEFHSVSKDHDQNIGSHAGQLLDWISAVPTSLNMAFESKGKVTTKSLKAVTVNTNATASALCDLYAQPDALLGRALWVTVETKASVRTEGRFDPTKLDECSIDVLNEHVQFTVSRGKKGAHKKIVWSVVGEYNLINFIEFLANELNSGVSGKKAAVSAMFSSIVDIRVPVGASVSLHVPGRVDVPSVVAGDVEVAEEPGGFIVEEFPTFEEEPVVMEVGLGCSRMSEMATNVSTLAHAAEQGVQAAATSACRYVAYMERWKCIRDTIVRWLPILGAGMAAAAALRYVMKSKKIVSDEYSHLNLGPYRRPIERESRPDFVRAARGMSFQEWCEGGDVVEHDGACRPQRFEKFSEEVLSMPRAIDPARLGSEDRELREWMGKSFEVKPNVPNDSLVYSIGRSAVMPLSSVQKVSDNVAYIDVEVIEGVGCGQVDSAHCFVWKGIVMTVGHLFPEGALRVRVCVQSTTLPRGRDFVELRAGQWVKIKGHDVAILTTRLPSLVQDLRKNLREGPVSVGDEFVLLGAFDRPPLKGRVTYVGPYDYTVGKFPNKVNKRVERVVKASATGSEKGDCGRIAVVMNKAGITFGGIHFGSTEVGNEVLTDLVPLSLVDEARNGMNSVILESGMFDCEMGHVRDPSQIVDGVPRHGVFSLESFAPSQTQLPVLGLGANSKRGKSGFKESVFYPRASELLKGMGRTFAPAPMGSEWRFDDAIGLNRKVSPFEKGLKYEDIKSGCPKLDDLEDWARGMIDYISPHLVRDECPSFVGIDEALESIGTVKAIDVTTGAAMPTPGKKCDFVFETYAGGSTHRIAKDELREAVFSHFHAMSSGVVPCGISKVSLKDEILKESKVTQMGTRLIHVVAMDEYVLTRMLWGRIASILFPVLQKMCGMWFRINVHSPMWAEVHRRSVELRGGARKNADGDFEKFDIHHLFVVLVYLFIVLEKLAEKIYNGPKGVFRVAILSLWQVIRKATLIDGVWTDAFLGGPSGSFWTVFFNCMAQCAYWFITWRECRGGGTFVEFVEEFLEHWSSLGDDCMASPPKQVTLFMTPDRVVEIMLSRCGQVLTGSGVKGKFAYEGNPVFLKRGFRWEGNRMVAPLEIASLYKSLLYYDSKSLGDADERLFQLLSNVHDEALFHPDDVRVDLRLLVCELQELLCEKNRKRRFRSDAELWRLFDSGSLDMWGQIALSGPPEGDLPLLREETRHGIAHRERGPCGEVIKVQEKDGSAAIRLASSGRRDEESLPVAEQTSEGHGRPPDKNNWSANMEKNSTTVASPGELEEPGIMVSEGKDDTGTGTFEPDTTFGKVVVSLPRDRVSLPAGELGPVDDTFKRPFVIWTLAWSSSMTEVPIKPFVSWFNIPAVRGRFITYSRARFRLRLRIEFSPNAHHLGMARMWFSPADQYFWNSNLEGKGRAWQNLGVTLNAGEPGVRELVLPWVLNDDYADLSIAGQLERLGSLRFTPIVELARDDAVSVGTVQIIVRAWAEDVELAGPSRAAVVNQSSFGERAQKVVGTIGKIPAVAAVAGTARSIAGGVTSFLDMLGWSRDISTDRMRVLTRPSGYAPIDGPDDSLPLAFTRSQGIVGSPSDVSAQVADEMSFSFIGQRDSLVDIGLIAYDDLIDDKILDFPVHPCVAFMNGTSHYTPSAVGMVARPFASWRGSLIYRFEVVCSQLQSGSIRIVYDPVPPSIAPLYDTESARNCVLELKPGATCELCVGWSSPYLWAKTPTMSLLTTSKLAEECNGNIELLVATPLMSPSLSSTSNVSIIVSVRAGPDFEVMEQRALPGFTWPTAAPSLGAMAEGGGEFLTSEEIIEEAAVTSNIAARGQTVVGTVRPPGFEKHSMGESIVSLRAILKRYYQFGVATAPTAGTAGVTDKSFIVSGWIHEGTGPVTTSDPNAPSVLLSMTTVYKWFGNMYVGRRGGARYRFRVLQSRSATETPYQPIWRAHVAHNIASTNTTDTSAAVAPLLGSEVFEGNQGERCDFIAPDYSRHRFSYNCPSFDDSYDPEDGYPMWGVTITRAVNIASGWSYNVSKAVDEDFSFLFFVGAPNLTTLA